MGRKLSGSTLLVAALLCLPTAVMADEPSTAALKSEIDALKSRLAQLERQASTGGGFQGTSSLADKPSAPGALELPSGLSGLALSGFADVSYIYNINEPDAGVSRTNRGRTFDTEPNGFTPHAFELALEKPLTDSEPIGFRADIYAGDDADVIGSAGLANAGNDQFDLQQAYVMARAPFGNGIDFKVGKFVTLLGAEVIESPANWNFSRSYLFGFAIPFTHTGALATYNWGELGSTTLGVVNGWDNVDDNNKAKSVIANYTVSPVDDLTLAFNGITGAEQADDNRDDRSVFDFVATWQATDQLAFMANYDYGHESGVGGNGVNWTGLALYAKYDMTPTWSLIGRTEWFDDKNNARTALTAFDGLTPTDIDYYGITLTSQWKLHEHLLARLEYRHDKASERVFFRDAAGFSSYQDTVAAELIYHF